MSKVTTRHKIWSSSTFDWTEQGMKECIYDCGEWTTRADYLKRMSENVLTIAELYERIRKLEESLARAALRLEAGENDDE